MFSNEREMTNRRETGSHTRQAVLLEIILPYLSPKENRYFRKKEWMPTFFAIFFLYYSLTIRSK